MRNVHTEVAPYHSSVEQAKRRSSGRAGWEGDVGPGGKKFWTQMGRSRLYGVATLKPWQTFTCQILIENLECATVTGALP